MLLRLLYIGTGIGITALVWEEPGPLRFLGLSILLSGYHLFMLVFVDLYAYISGSMPDENDVRVTRYDYVKTFRYSSAVFLFGLLAILSSSQTIGDTIRGMDLFWKSAAAGAIVATLLLIRFFRRRKGLIPGNYAYVIGLQFAIGFTLTTIASAENLNRFIPEPGDQTRVVRVTDKTIGGKRHNRHWLFLELDGETERVQVSEHFYFSCGDSVKIRTTTGLFGYAYIERFRIAE